MSVHNNFSSITIVSGADLSAAQYKAVTYAGVIAANGNTAAGLLQDDPAAANRHAQVGVQGGMPAYAGAAIALGAQLTVTASGYVITATSGSAVVGKAAEAANSGDLFRGQFDFRNASTLA